MKILVVGAGIAGLSMARALRQRGITAEVIDRQSDNPAPGAGLFLPGNASRAIEQLGLLDKVADKAVPIKQQVILDSHGRRLNAIDAETIWRDCGRCFALPRRDFMDILMDPAGRPAITFGRTIASLSTQSDGCEVTFDDRSAGHYDVVVGADGIHSSLRTMTGLGDNARYVGNVCWRFITKNTTGVSCWTAMLGNGRTLLAIPVSQTEVYVYADLAVSAGDIAGLSRTSPLRKLFGDFRGPVFPLVDRLSSDAHIQFGPIEEVRLTDWLARRVVLIGDAAHGSSPNMAGGRGWRWRMLWCWRRSSRVRPGSTRLWTGTRCGESRGRRGYRTSVTSATASVPGRAGQEPPLSVCSALPSTSAVMHRCSGLSDRPGTVSGPAGDLPVGAMNRALPGQNQTGARTIPGAVAPLGWKSRAALWFEVAEPPRSPNFLPNFSRIASFNAC